MKNFEKWKQNLKPEDLIIDKGENAKRAQEGKPKFDYDRETPKGEWV